MRSTRLSLAVLTAAACLGAAPLAAQGSANWDVRPNSWYWGLYGGQTSFPTSIARTYAPVVGGEWTITRSRFALNVFAEQSYFNAVSTITDFPTSAPRRVDIKDLRRVGAAAFSFLPPYKYFHPYFGVGYAFNMIREATPQGSPDSSAAARDTISARIESARTAGKISRSEMNDRSPTTRSTSSPSAPAASILAFTRSCTTTRGSARNRGCSCP